MEMTREEFKGAINKANKDGKVFNIESVDSSSVYLALYGCTIELNEDCGVEGDIAFFRPKEHMEVRIDFAIIDAFYKEEGEFRLEFNNGMPDVDITECKNK